MNRQYQVWHKALATVIRQQGAPEFWSALIRALNCLVTVERPLVLLYNTARTPSVLHESFTEEEFQRHISSYVNNGIYLLDPFYQLSLRGIPSGLYRLGDVTPDRFRQTEFYKRYYKDTGITDEASYIINVDGKEFIHISLIPAEKNAYFNRAELRRLQDIADLLVALVQRHYRDSKAVLPSDSTSLHSELQQALTHFGGSLLTEREQQVLQLVLHGHSNQAVAEKLAISLATVKLHRKNAYQKLDIRSQAELFYLFIDSLSGFDPGVSSDPLVQYLSKN